MLESVLFETPSKKLLDESISKNEKLVESSKDRKESLVILRPEDKYNLVGFFALLLRVDKRNNSHLYNLVSN